MNNPALLNMGLVFGLMQLANKFNLDGEENTTYLRIAYMSMQLCAFGAFYYVYLKVTSTNDTTPITYSEPKSAIDPTLGDPITTTHKEYDLKKLKEVAKSQLVSLGMIALMHFKWGYLRPLLLQSILGLKALYDAQLVQIHLFGTPATGALQRPWKAASPLAGLTGDAATPAVDAAAAAPVASPKVENKKEK
ncbi:phosphate transporter (Pho88) [Thoreauomyces humboldtii]|nr:phosphate transporter (Pho88) [Thoreauomyces humboldtii]